MLGCKVQQVTQTLASLQGINRYMLGCKENRNMRRGACLRTELIDTCWDVKRHKLLVLYQSHSELIDTCWDVKMNR